MATNRKSKTKLPPELGGGISYLLNPQQGNNGNKYFLGSDAEQYFAGNPIPEGNKYYENKYIDPQTGREMGPPSNFGADLRRYSDKGVNYLQQLFGGGQQQPRQYNYGLYDAGGPTKRIEEPMDYPTKPYTIKGSIF